MSTAIENPAELNDEMRKMFRAEEVTALLRGIGIRVKYSPGVFVEGDGESRGNQFYLDFSEMDLDELYTDAREAEHLRLAVAGDLREIARRFRKAAKRLE